jgi:formate dehydrogenase major subunit
MPARREMPDAMIDGQRATQNNADAVSRIRGAEVKRTVCPYCAVGCGQLAFVKDGRLLDVEGDPDSPINRGTLCPKGAATFQLAVNPNRLTEVLYRAPFSRQWERRPLSWAMEQIAERIKTTRDETFVERLPDGRTVNACYAIESLGGATLDNEENYLIKKLLCGGLGVIPIENQARI